MTHFPYQSEQKEDEYVKHQDLISKMTLEEKCYLMSGKDFWQTRSVERLGVSRGDSARSGARGSYW